MKLWLPFALLGALCLVGAFTSVAPASKMLWVYVAVNFICLSLACRFGRPGIWLKRSDGVLHPASYVLFLPLHALNALSWLVAMSVNKEAMAHCVAPNVWLGRRITSSEASALFGDATPAVLDLTSEFPETYRLRAGRYLCLPVVDHAAPTQSQLRAGVDFISSNSKDGAVYIHCALGHGRSATVVAAWVLRNDPSLTIEAAIQRLRAIRFGVRINSEQQGALEVFAAELRKPI